MFDEKFRLELLALACVGLLSSVLIVGIRLIWRPRRRLPPPFYRPVPWSGWEVCLALLLFLGVPAIVTPLVLSSHFLDQLYGLDFKEVIDEKDPQGDAFAPGQPASWVVGPAPAAGVKGIKEFAHDRLSSWVSALAVPGQVALILFFLGRISGTRPSELGLTAANLAGDTALGATAWLVVTPAVWALNILVSLVQKTPSEHPLTRLILGQPLLVDWFLLLFITLAAAPLLEELIFRGVLQQWLSRRPWGGWAALIAALVLALFSRTSRLFDAVRERDVGLLLSELAPVWFVLLLIPGMFLMERLAPRLFPPAAPSPSLPDVEEEEATYLPDLPNSFAIRPEPSGEEISIGTARAWYGVAVLFAAAHSFVWPSPIPLFALGLALGWLALRTQRLVPGIVLHALFNGVTCVMLILG